MFEKINLIVKIVLYFNFIFIGVSCGSIDGGVIDCGGILGGGIEKGVMEGGFVL